MSEAGLTTSEAEKKIGLIKSERPQKTFRALRPFGAIKRAIAFVLDFQFGAFEANLVGAPERLRTLDTPSRRSRLWLRRREVSTEAEPEADLGPGGSGHHSRRCSRLRFEVNTFAFFLKKDLVELEGS